jgi:peptidoglycan/LPS O-acetylase OafA/YrhL
LPEVVMRVLSAPQTHAVTVPTERSPRVAALDGLRGCAIALVLAGHARTHQSQPLGAAGVTLFFVLSGYLITLILVRNRASATRGSLRSFYGRRARRLLPALALLLFFDAAVRLLTGQSLVPVLLAGSYVTNLAASAGASSTLSHTWSLAMEEQFYIVWPLLLPLVWRLRRGTLVVLGAAAVAAIARVVIYLMGPWTVAYFSPATRCDAILVGCALALATARGWRLPGGRWGRLVVGVAVLVMCAPFLWTSMGVSVALIPAVALASAALVATLAQPGTTMLHRVLAVAPLRYVGRVSYGMYLWHPFVLAAVVGLAIPVPFVATLLISIALASASWVLIERRWLEPERRRRRVVVGLPTTAGTFTRAASRPTAR